MKNTPRRIRIAAVVVLIAIPAIAAEVAFAQNARKIAQDSFPSVVLLLLNDRLGQPVSLGSGFFVGPNTIATNQHVVEGASSGYAKVVGQNAKYSITGLVAADPARDLVLLAVADANVPPLSIGDSAQVAVGDDVYVVGNPRGLEGTFSQGIVSSIRTVGQDNLLQITAPISPGSSGGPVLNGQGKVIGVAVATFRGGQNLNFAIPSSYLTSLLKKTTTASQPQPLSEGVATRNSIIREIGEPATAGVFGSQFAWDSMTPFISAHFKLSLHNQLASPVKDIYCLVIFYDNAGSPLDFATLKWADTIPPGLAKRIEGEVNTDIQRNTTPSNSLVPSTKFEIRVLDFKIVDE